MKAIDVLKQDHTALQMYLNDLEQTLFDSPEKEVRCRIWYRLFLRRHAAHVRRKAWVITSCRSGLATLVPEELAHAEHEHDYESQLFRRVGRLLLRERSSQPSRGRLCGCFTRAAMTLRRHMHEEEAALWPAIQHILTKRERDGCRRETVASPWWEGTPWWEGFPDA